MYLNDLPQQAENQMLLSIADVVWPDVDDVTTNGFGASQSELEILELLVDGQRFSFVDGAFVDGVWR